jgi:NADH dehydrogenase
MKRDRLNAVTGAFGYTGKYIAGRLLNKGHDVITLTNSMHRENPFGGKIKAIPFNFDDPDKLKESLKGVRILYNNYWVRFNHRSFTHNEAVENTTRLFNAAKEAGVQRIVHISITNPSKDSKLEYFSGKAILEEALINSGVSYAILRPTVIFGDEDILINNIAWALRHFPVFFTFGYGSCRLQPIFVDDLAKLAVEFGDKSENVIIDATGPETFTYKELVENIGDIIGCTRLIIPMPPALAYALGFIVSKLVNDVFVTREEIEGLMANLLCVDSAPTGQTKLTAWMIDHAGSLGRKYHSELARRRDRIKAY